MPAQTAQSGDSVRDLLEKILENQAAFIDGGGGGGGSVASTDVQFAATNRLLGRITSGAGAGEELTGAQVRTIAGLATSDTPTFAGLAGIATMTGGAGNMTITAGTGNSRTLTLQSTTSGGTATNALTISATQQVAVVAATASTTTTTGALIVSGGIGVALRGYFGQRVVAGATALSLSNWGFSGVQFQAPATTFTDSSSSAFANPVAFSSFARPTLASTNAVLSTGAATVYIAGEPIAGTNTTIDPTFLSNYSLLVDRGFVFLGGRLACAGQGGGMDLAAWGEYGAAFYAYTNNFRDVSTAASGTAAMGHFASFDGATFSALNSNVTISDAATVYIKGPPTGGTNMTLTRAFALWIDSGSFRLDGTTGAGAGAGTLANAPSAGDPDKWIPINSDGVQYWFPAWAA